MREVTLTVFYEGTIFSIEELHTPLHRALHRDCEGVRIKSADDLKDHSNVSHFKMGFNGCGVDYGVRGLAFGTGLEEQNKQVESVVRSLIKEGCRVKLNLVGLSRGGIASLLLTKNLAYIDPIHLETNLLLLDPVPGNLLLTAKLDVLDLTLAKQSMDVSHSRNLKCVEAYYPYLEVGDDSEDRLDKFLAYFHIPMRPTYPDQCEVHEDVILGAHLSAFEDVTKQPQTKAVHGVDIIPIVRQLSRELIYKFLKKVGALSVLGKEATDPTVLATQFTEDNEKWNEWLTDLITDIRPKNRPFHSQDSSTLSARNTGQFFNKVHSGLVNAPTINDSELSLKLIPTRPGHLIVKEDLSKSALVELINVSLNGMTVASRAGEKGKLLRDMQRKLVTDDVLDQTRLSFVLRDILTVVLQRDRNRFSLFNTTDSGKILVQFLNNSEFRCLSLCIRPDGKPITYEDLGGYVLGRNDLSHFNSSLKDLNLLSIQPERLGTDTFGMLL